MAGNPLEGMWIVGPLVRGTRFEATAVPELRGIAETAASEILRAFSNTKFSRISEAVVGAIS